MGASLALLALTTACAPDAAGPSSAEASEAPLTPDVTYYVVGFHWGWAVFDEDGNELDGIRVTEGTNVELYAVNDAAEEAIGRLPAPVAAAINAIEWDGERTRLEIEAGRLPDPQVVLGMSLEDVMGHDDDDDDHADEADDAAHTDEGDDDADDHADGDDDPAGDLTEHANAGDADDADADDRIAGSMPASEMPWLGEERELETHGFLIPWYGVAAKLEPDASEPVHAVFTADRPGTFEFECTVYCGFGHQYQQRELLFVDAAQ